MPRDLIKETNRLYRRDGMIKKSIQAQTVAAFTALAQQQGISTIGLTPELNKADEQAIVDFSNNEDDIEPTLYGNIPDDMSHLYETPQLQELFDENEITEEIKELLEKIKKIESNITSFQKNIKASEVSITNANNRMTATKPKANTNTIEASKLTITKEKENIKSSNKSIDDLLILIPNKEKRIQRLRDDIVGRNKQIKVDNQLELSRVDKENKKIPITYTSKQLTSKYKNESESEYLSRIGLDNAIVYEGYLFQSRQKVILEFKNHLKELVRKEKVIEQINNSIESEPDSIELRQNFNKLFPKIKEDFFKLFGTDKKKLDKLTGDDIMNFINGLSNKPSINSFF
jgi:hypothetical protein